MKTTLPRCVPVLSPRIAGAGLITLLLSATALLGHASAQTPPQPAGGTGVPPQLALGRRVAEHRVRTSTLPTLVIVPNPGAFAAAIAQWTPSVRFPVLIDDGSDRAREDIARFVRAFEPAGVLRWDASDAPAWPEDAAARRAAFELALRQSWDAPEQGDVNESLREVWNAASHTPPGVVVASPADPAWTAALAVAAGHGQPVVWADAAPGPTGATVTLEVAQAGIAHIERGLEALGWSWRSAGDDIEAITLCLSTPARVQGKAGGLNKSGLLALTDLVGRGPDGARIAWCGMIPGESAPAAYMAMCSLFLQPTRAWLFDGYAGDFAPPYKLPAAAKLLEAAGLKVSANLGPRGGATDWRERAAFGVPFDLIHVNSSGNPPWFDLTPGRVYASDVPVLERPAIVHFIHSYSAQAPEDRTTVAGAWLERGAYAYLGSMDEPYLGAFFPAEQFIGRLLEGAPFGVAVRQDTQPPWKLNVIGDPLVQVGRAAPRAEGAPELPGAQKLETLMQRAMRERDLERGAAMLVMLGREDEARALASAALAQPQAMTPGLARVLLQAVFRGGDAELFVRVFAGLDDAGRAVPLHTDLLWQAARPVLGQTSDASLVGWLRSSVRSASVVEDAQSLAPAIKRVFGVEAARSFFGQLLQRPLDAQTKDQLREAGAKY